MKKWSILMVISLFPVLLQAHGDSFLAGNTLKRVDFQLALDEVKPGSIVIIGENHGIKEHQQQQMMILTGLRQRGHKVSVGLEFFTYTYQKEVDFYRQGLLSEVEFLKAIGWGSPSYDFYRDQALFPNLHDGATTIALNAPRTLTNKVAKMGLDSLSPQDRSLLPLGFELGRDSYRQRFYGSMPHLPSPDAKERYFAAQSIWDDTMAWSAVSYMADHPGQTLVIVVGEFHVQFGGGLPDRILKRSPNLSVVTVSQLNTSGLTADEIAQEIQFSPTEGPRANFLWLAPAGQ